MILSQSIELMTDNILLHCNRPMKFKCRKPDLLIENHGNDNRNTPFKKICLSISQKKDENMYDTEVTVNFEERKF